MLLDFIQRYTPSRQMLARHPPTEIHRAGRAEMKSLALPLAAAAICDSEFENLPGSVAPESGAIFREKKMRPKRLAPTVGAHLVGSVFVAGKWPRNPGPFFGRIV